MSEPKDPEQLLADALRAQAVFAPQAAPRPEPGTDAVPTAGLETPSGYGLLSGADASSLERERAALDRAEASSPTAPVVPPDPETVRVAPVPGSAPLPAYWVLLLAVLLGLAAGSVVGLLTLV
jgi:hypothetical protein